MDFEAEFARAWATPGYSRWQQPDIDVNAVLSDQYELSRPLLFTRAMLWDLEVRKAVAPGDYIPFVVEVGTARSWGRRGAPGGGEYVDRCSRQRLWTRPQERALVLERAFLNHRDQRVTFLGVSELRTDDGSLLRADATQALFHVEHSVGGTEDRPLNRWRIVHLTESVDGRILERHEEMARQPWLPEFIELYIRRVVGLELTRRGDHHELA